MRIRVQSYRPSASAKELALALGVPRIQHTNSKFRGKPSDLIINWGNVNVVHNSRYLNPLQAVKNATNKLATFNILKQANVSIPPFFTSHSELDPDATYVARTTLTGHSGEGIGVGLPADLPAAPLYTTFLAKQAEYRVIVVGSQAIDIKQKLKKRDFEGDRSPYVWNCDNGYVYARNDIHIPDDLASTAIAAVAALGLTYGAVDIILHDNIPYVLEVNTAFGLCGSTTQLVASAIQSLIEAT